jgi:hypothetical protein
LFLLRLRSIFRYRCPWLRDGGRRPNGNAGDLGKRNEHRPSQWSRLTLVSDITSREIRALKPEPNQLNSHEFVRPTYSIIRNAVDGHENRLVNKSAKIRRHLRVPSLLLLKYSSANLLDPSVHLHTPFERCVAGNYVDVTSNTRPHPIRHCSVIRSGVCAERKL